MDFHYPTDMTRQQAFIRRSEKCISILNREDIKEYQGEGSIKTLAHYIKIIIEALETSLPADEIYPFLKEFRELRKQVLDTFEDEHVAKVNYDEVVALMISTLREYKEHINGVQ